MKRLLLAAGLLTAFAPLTMARETRPALTFLQELNAKQSAALGTYKAEMPGVPTIVIKAKGAQLIMAAEGFPELDVTLNDKGELSAAVLPEGFKFTLIKDKDGKVTGMKVETPMGGGDLKRVEAAKPVAAKPEAKKAEVPDVLGVYESDEIEGMRIKGEMVWEKGKLMLKTDGQPDLEVKIGKDDSLTTTPEIPDVTSMKLTRDKDGKVIGSVLETAQGKLNFTRKTFPKPPGAEAPKAEAAAGLPDVLGKYEAEDPASPVAELEVLVKEGKLVIMVEGQPEINFTLDKMDNVVAPNSPEGITSKFQRDKDGKITHLIADTPVGKLSFKRKTFPKPPTAEKTDAPKKADAADPLARLKALEGIYTTDMPGLPVVTMRIKDGKLVVEPEGDTPISDAKLSEKDELSGEGLPDGFTVTIDRDKDGKVTGMTVKTPMGDAKFTRAPLK
ncbi:hypothetical protein [Armatimonas sp.]|uniref:hypothetical protein n=1 Tax=Armatimonas sp. TaxID=1872638 RepID=UPI00286D62DF|nr:hypothetical protein [Armatimonas sp.]